MVNKILQGHKTIIQRLHWPKIKRNFYFILFYLSETKKYVLLEVKIQEKDERSFP